jgi:regulator of protease activity HflC (stomatin/prohibitin superfamily)
MITSIPQNHCRVIERFGKPIRVQKSGLAFKIPFLEKEADLSHWEFAQKQDRFIELSEQINAYDERTCITKDNAQVVVNVVLSWRIVHPIKALYEVDNLFQSLEQAVLNMVRSEIGSQELDETLANRTTLNERMASGLASTLKKWGLQLVRVEIQEIHTDGETSKAMLQQLDAERRSRAIVSEAEGEAKRTLLKANAEKDAAIATAEGKARALELLAVAEADYLRTLSESIGPEQASKMLLAQKVVDGLDRITSNEAHKVFLPSGPQGVLDLMGDPAPRT